MADSGHSGSAVQICLEILRRARRYLGNPPRFAVNEKRLLPTTIEINFDRLDDLRCWFSIVRLVLIS